MTIFNAIGVAGTGVTLHRKWLDAVSDNIANIDNVTSTSDNAFQARYVLAREAQDGNGTEVAGTALGNAEGRVVFEPNHPLADAEGNVRYPDIDLGDQMAQLMMAQRAYQANLSVVDRARDTYTAAIQLGEVTMTSPIESIGALSSVGGIAPLAPLQTTGSTDAVSGPNTDFAGMLANGLQNVQNLQHTSEDLAVKVADGTLADPAQYTMASTEAALAVQLTMAVRNKAVEAFQEIMRMQA